MGHKNLAKSFTEVFKGVTWKSLVHLLPWYIRVTIKSQSACRTFRPHFLLVISKTHPRNEPKAQYNRSLPLVFWLEKSFRDCVRTGRSWLFEYLFRSLNGTSVMWQDQHEKKFPLLASGGMKTSSRADLAKSRSCHSDYYFMVKKPRYISYSIFTGNWYNTWISKSPCEYKKGAVAFYFAQQERARGQKELSYNER